jgi:quercetin dioxygenase-like cupin family protein
MHVKLLLTSEETASAYSVAEITAAPGGFVPPHAHAREDEMFYVLSGTFEFELADSVITAPSGTFVHVPRQTLHGFRNAGRAVGRLLDVHTPGGFEKFFLEAGTKCDDAQQGPPEGAPDMPRFLQICRKHGMEI